MSLPIMTLLRFLVVHSSLRLQIILDIFLGSFSFQLRNLGMKLFLCGMLALS